MGDVVAHGGIIACRLGQAQVQSCTSSSPGLACGQLSKEELAMRNSILLTMLSLLALSGCATYSSAPPVQVMYATPPMLSPDTAISVVPEPGEVDWSAEQALRSSGQTVDAGSPWRLRVAERAVLRARSFNDPFCNSWGGMGGYYGRGWGGGGYWGRDPWCNNRVDVRSTRTVFWALEDASGRVVWQAQSREPQVDHPPSLASQRLASALALWRGSLVP